MRRADRLFRIVQHLRSGRLLTARTLGERLEVSPRTIYRDIADLMASGVPIDGEAGVGYLMRAGYDLPPLMFTREEVTALVAGIRMLQAWGGSQMARSAADALAKIESALPDEDRRRAEAIPIRAFDMAMPPSHRHRLDELNAAIENRTALHIAYSDAQGEASRRVVEPLSLYYWGKVWTLVAWCRLREDFRMFRLDRIEATEPRETFVSAPGRRIGDFLATVDGRDFLPAAAIGRDDVTV